MALNEIEFYTPPGIDPERVRIRRVDGESEPAFRAFGIRRSPDVGSQRVRDRKGWKK
jgi:hypothetical protein